MTRALERGQLLALDEDSQADQLELITATLRAAGYERYEVSNFAKPGHRGQHNESTWRGNPYMGLGPGAHGFRPDGGRTVGAAAFEAWLQAPEGAVSWPTPTQAALDLMLCTLRHVDGLPLAALAGLGFGLDPAACAPLQQGGWLRQEADHLRLTEAGAPLVDALLRRLRDALRPLGAPPARA
jgi:oxygen-independent coproporphyrinogen-3 oxidase